MIVFPEYDLCVPFRMGGIISRIQMCLPMQEELDNCLWIDLRGEQEWDPYTLHPLQRMREIFGRVRKGYEQED